MSERANKLLVITALLMLSLSVATKSQQQSDSGQSPSQPLQEVFQSELVYPQEKGALQFTSTSSFGRVGRKFSHEVSLEYGITKAWQVDLQWESFARSVRDDGSITHGTGDLRLGTKYSFMNIHGSHFHSAIGFEIGLPAAGAAKGISERQMEYEPYVIVARDFPGWSRLQLFSQLGLNFTRPLSDSATPDAHRFSRTLKWTSGMFVAFHRARFTNEIGWSKSTAENDLSFTPGIVWKLPHDLEFGVGVPLGLTHNAERLRTIVKLVYEFGGEAGDKEHLEQMPTTPRNRR
jgi:hypothetical protein